MTSLVFQYREITIIGENDATFRCSIGVKEGEEIVVNGAFRIDAAAQLLIKTA